MPWKPLDPTAVISQHTWPHLSAIYSIIIVKNQQSNPIAWLFTWFHLRPNGTLPVGGYRSCDRCRRYRADVVEWSNPIPSRASTSPSWKWRHRKKKKRKSELAAAPTGYPRVFARWFCQCLTFDWSETNQLESFFLHLHVGHDIKVCNHCLFTLVARFQRCLNRFAKSKKNQLFRDQNWHQSAHSRDFHDHDCLFRLDQCQEGRSKATNCSRAWLQSLYGPCTHHNRTELTENQWTHTPARSFVRSL